MLGDNGFQGSEELIFRECKKVGCSVNKASLYIVITAIVMVCMDLGFLW